MRLLLSLRSESERERELSVRGRESSCRLVSDEEVLFSERASQSISGGGEMIIQTVHHTFFFGSAMSCSWSSDLLTKRVVL